MSEIVLVHVSKGMYMYSPACVCARLIVFLKNRKIGDERMGASINRGRKKSKIDAETHKQQRIQITRTAEPATCHTHTDTVHGHTETKTHTHTDLSKDNHVRQEKFWMDGAEQRRRCKECPDVNNLEVAV